MPAETHLIFGIDYTVDKLCTLSILKNVKTIVRRFSISYSSFSPIGGCHVINILSLSWKDSSTPVLFLLSPLPRFLHLLLISLPSSLLFLFLLPSPPALLASLHSFFLYHRQVEQCAVIAVLLPVDRIRTRVLDPQDILATVA